MLKRVLHFTKKTHVILNIPTDRKLDLKICFVGRRVNLIPALKQQLQPTCHLVVIFNITALAFNLKLARII